MRRNLTALAGAVCHVRARRGPGADGPGSVSAILAAFDDSAG
ncbi:MAG: hypothetical protein OYL41_00460 [Acidobacteriota bacterium]|nr:hypothetical protein [Acidobacteriota bacterium]